MKRNFIYILYFMAMLLLGVLATACGDGRPKYRIGVSQCSDDDWRTKLNEEIHREMLFHDDAVVDIRTANDDNERQIADIEHFISEGYDIIIAAPNQADALTPVLRKAYESGIPVVIFDRGVNGDSYTSFIEFDNYGIGRTAAEYTVSQLPDGGGDVAEIRGLSGSTPAAGRHSGFVEGLAPYEGIKVVASVDGEWKRSVAERKMDSLLNVHPDLKLVYAHNDIMAIGASDVLRRRGRRDIKVLGTDAVPNVGMKAVIDSVIDATFIYPTDGQRLVQTAMAIIKGEPYEKKVLSPALPPVDIMNAELLRRQRNLLSEETEKIRLLQAKNADVVSQNHVQSALLYMALALGALLVVIIAMLFRLYRQRVRMQRMLTVKNGQLEQEKKKVEQEKMKQEDLYRQLDDATKSKLVFFTNVSHDLRTPLTLIMEPVERLGACGYLQPKELSLIRIAEKNTRILRRMIDQILDFRRYENGKSSLVLTEVRIGALIEEWVSSFGAVADKRDIRLRLESDTTSELTMAVDVEKLERVVFNLISNAFKYSPDNSTVIVRWNVDGDALRVSVSDEGIGISEEDRERIFDRFYQAEKVRPKGSGIGLSLSKAFVELHGGVLGVESRYGEGSVFTLSIPVKHVATDPEDVKPNMTAHDVEVELSPGDTDVRMADTDKPLLLLIDDNEDIRRMGVELLSDEYNVITAADGRMGVRLATKFVPDIVICDIMMPVMDGLECCRILKGEISTSHIPVLVLTASSLDERRMESYDSGADGFLSKPFNTAMLHSRCRNLLDNRRRIKELYEQKESPEPNKEKTEKARLRDMDDPHSMESDFYRKFLDIIKESYGNAELNTTDMAGRLGLGPAQLTRKIKALTNYAPMEILKNFRLKLAREQLTSTEDSISEISYRVGFSSPAYFTKCFRLAFGETPSELRDRLCGSNR